MNAVRAMNVGRPGGFPKLAKLSVFVGLGLAAVAPSAAFAASTPMPGVSTAVTDAAVAKPADARFKALFMSWKKLDPVQPGAIAIPASKPVKGVQLTSSYGVRSDPFQGTARMHAGLDLAGPLGTSIYATADGYVGRAQRAGAYGNLVELEHGKGIQTRYAHLSSMLVRPGQRVKRGDLIARMGSTGRSTGSHLHYEVRIDGRAVNPIPFMGAGDYVQMAERRAAFSEQLALGGPGDQE